MITGKYWPSERATWFVVSRAIICCVPRNTSLAPSKYWTSCLCFGVEHARYKPSKTFLCFLFTSTAFPQKTSSVTISSFNSQPWPPTKNSTQINCTRGELRSSTRYILIYVPNYWPRGKQSIWFSQESWCFTKQSRGKHRRSRENKTVSPLDP